MSRVLTHREIIPRRPDCLADDAGCGEPVSGSEFPVIREKNRQFRGIACLEPKISANLIANSECYCVIPCATEQGIAFARTGNIERQNRECLGAIRESAADRKLSPYIDPEAGRERSGRSAGDGRKALGVRPAANEGGRW